MDDGRNFFIRIGAVLFYLATFIGIQAGLHYFVSMPSDPQSHIVYSDDKIPEYFPVLLKISSGENINELMVRSLSMSDHGPFGSRQDSDQWSIYNERGEGHLVDSSLVAYTVESLSPVRSKITLSLGEENRRRCSTYTYEVEGNHIYPRQYLLQTAVGDDFSPMPFTVGLTLLIVLLGEKFVVRRLRKKMDNS